MSLGGTSLWLLFIALSVGFDVAASVYLKVAGDKVDGFGFFWATVVGVVMFAPSIILIGYSLKFGPSYIATIGIWAVGVYAVNTVVGVMAFGDPFGTRTAIGVATACATVVLLKPT